MASLRLAAKAHLQPIVLAAAICVLWCGAEVTWAQSASSNRSSDAIGAANQPLEAAAPPAALPGTLDVEEALSPGGLSATLKIMVLLTVLSLAPSILMMTTCFVRFVIVLGLLRQALGTQQLPPNQVITSLCLFMTFMIMMPVWQEAYREGVRPYTSPYQGEVQPTLEQAFDRTMGPLRRFMTHQIQQAGNEDAVFMLLDYQQAQRDVPQDIVDANDIPLSVLLPAYMLSELKTAFIIGFQIYLPFIVIDMVISSVLISMGMMMLPPVIISMPFKLLLFILIDGWALTVGKLIESVSQV